MTDKSALLTEIPVPLDVISTPDNEVVPAPEMSITLPEELIDDCEILVVPCPLIDTAFNTDSISMSMKSQKPTQFTSNTGLVSSVLPL